METYEEYHDGAGQMDIVLNNIPVVSTTTVQYNSGTYSAPVWTGFDLDSYNTDKKS